MNYLDIIIVVLVAYFAFKGFKKGLVVEIASLIALILGIYGAVKLSGYALYIMQTSLNMNFEYNGIIAFALTFIIIVILVHFVAKLVTKLLKAVALNFINKFAGAIFATAKIVLILSIIFWLFNSLNEKTNFIGEDVKNRSLLYRPISAIAPSLYPLVEDLQQKYSTKE